MPKLTRRRFLSGVPAVAVGTAVVATGGVAAPKVGGWPTAFVATQEYKDDQRARNAAALSRTNAVSGLVYDIDTDSMIRPTPLQMRLYRRYLRGNPT